VSSVTVGSEAEEAAANYLKLNGFQIIDLNWRNRISEIDIIAKKGDSIYFVEVKYRRTNKAGDGFDYITHQKLRHMQRAAEAWVLTHQWQGEYQLVAAAVGADYKTIEIREID
jgi:putative endonuclease